MSAVEPIGRPTLNRGSGDWPCCIRDAVGCVVTPVAWLESTARIKDAVELAGRCLGIPSEEHSGMIVEARIGGRAGVRLGRINPQSRFTDLGPQGSVVALRVLNRRRNSRERTAQSQASVPPPNERGYIHVVEDMDEHGDSRRILKGAETGAFRDAPTDVRRDGWNMHKMHKMHKMHRNMIKDMHGHIREAHTGRKIL